MPKRVFYSDEENPYDYSPKSSTKTEYRDDEKAMPDGFIAPLKDEEIVPANLTGQQMGWGTINKNLGAPEQRSTDGATFGKNIDDAAFFSMDENGHTVVDSLKRNDFHWYTLFESVDGYDLTGASSTLGLEGVQIGTGATSGNTAGIVKQSTLFKGFSWDEKCSCKFGIRMQNSFSSGSHTAYFLRGDDSGNAIGFKISDNTIYGFVNETTVDIGDTNDYSGATSAAAHIFYVDYDPITGAKFYIDNVYLGEITTGLPSGISSAYVILNIEITTNENVAKILDLFYYDFWQAL